MLADPNVHRLLTMDILILTAMFIIKALAPD
jgi:hypothetical protein